jgi:hypothetical protein
MVAKVQRNATTGKNNRRGSPDRFDPATMLKTAKLVCRGGATMSELAEALNIGSATLYRWLNTYPELREAVNIGVDAFNPRVERALAERAIGGFVTLREGYRNERGTWIPPQRQYFPPDPTSMIFFLKNRMKEKYRDVHKVETVVQLKSTDDLRIEIDKELLHLKQLGYNPKIIDNDTGEEVT